MITVTEPKPQDEVMQHLEKYQSIFIIGCGTCTTLCHTGGKSEVLEMKKRLETAGKQVTGWMVIPTACDELTAEALLQADEDIEVADAILVMTCAFGVQTVSLYTGKPVFAALNTMFIGKEERPGYFTEACMQCGSCVLGQTACICPLVRCGKSLLNGPCGGSVGGKCEIDPDIPCAWQAIYDRLAAMGRLDEMAEIEPLRDWSTSLSAGPRKIEIEAGGAVVK